MQDLNAKMFSLEHNLACLFAEVLLAIMKLGGGLLILGRVCVSTSHQMSPNYSNLKSRTHVGEGIHNYLVEDKN